MRVLALTRYGRLGASSRVRFHQYVSGLGAQGIEVEFSPLFPDAYLEALYAGGRRPPSLVAAAYWGRLGRLQGANRYDLVWLEKECFPWLPAWAEERLAATGVPLVADYDDAIFHNYDAHRRAAVRRWLGDKIDRAMRCATTVVAGNRYLAARAQAAGAQRIEILPTVVDLERYVPPVEPGARPFTIGWIGSPATEHYLEDVAPALSALAREGCRILLVGASARAAAHIAGAEIRAWSEAGEVAALGEFDVGIMPLRDSPWERGKCGYKLIQCMALARPVVASPVGANRDIVRDGDEGFLAADVADWAAALRRLRDDVPLREAMGQRGRERVAREFSLQAALSRQAALLREAVQRVRGAA